MSLQIAKYCPLLEHVIPVIGTDETLVVVKEFVPEEI